MKKKLLLIALVLAVLVVVGAVALILSLDSGIEQAVERGGSYALKVPVELEDVSVSLLGGKASLRGLTVANPRGFETDRAIRLGEAAVEIKLGSVTGEVIEIPEIRVIAPELTVEGSLKGSNISRLLKNLDETMQQLPSGQEPAGEKPPEQAPEGPEQKYRIGRVLVTDATLRLSATFMKGRAGSATIRKIEIVPGNEPMTMAQLMKKVLGDIMKAGARNPGQVGRMLGGVVVSSGLGTAQTVSEAVETGAKQAGELTKKAGEATKQAGETAKKATEAGKKLKKGISDFFKKRKQEEREEE
jgi:hypothetical protein